MSTKKQKNITFSLSENEQKATIESWLESQSNKTFSLITLIINEINKNGITDIATIYPAKTIIQLDKMVDEVIDKQIDKVVVQMRNDSVLEVSSQVNNKTSSLDELACYE